MNTPKLFLSLTLICLASFSISAQKKGKTDTANAPTPAELRVSGQGNRAEQKSNSPFAGIPSRNVGPTVMSGRVTDLEVNPDRPTEFYVAYASGGLWHTNNNGQSFTPLFDQEAVMTIGDIAVVWTEPRQIWIGTGESNSSRSSYSGNGMYFSKDGGKNWQYKGLPESHHIGKVLVKPDNEKDILVAAVGHLYSPNPERGIYRSTDGGTTWTRSLFVNENTGGIDLVRDPNDPNHVYAAMWERSRRAWNFTEGGTGSGIYESKDGGSTWNLISGPQSGFPQGEGIGRIGLSAGSSEGKTVLYAILDNQTERPSESKETAEDEYLQAEDFKDMKVLEFLQLEDSLLSHYFEEIGLPEKHSPSSVKASVKSGELSPRALYDYVKDANNELFDVEIVGAELYRLENGKWKRTHQDDLDDVVYSYGYYFGLVRVDPSNADVVYIAGVPILRSEDGGKNFKSISSDNVHADHHSLWIDPNDGNHLINGNDGGINISYDAGQHYIKCNNPPVGQFYTVAVDEAKPYRVYGGLQDNGVWVGPSTYKPSPGWQQDGHYPYEMIMGGDGMQVAIDTRSNETVYTGYQFGHYYRIDRSSGDQTYIHPKHELGEKQLRWNWQTPIHLSKHNQDVLYMGSNRFHRSLDGGNSFETLSADLTQGGKPGNVPFGSLTSIDESPLQFGLLYVGSDDGLVHCSKDGGYTWTDVSAGLPKDLWVSRVEASNHSKSKLYVTLNGYRNDHFDAYVYVSNDFGKSWKRIGIDLPKEPVNVILEDPRSEGVLYVGTDHGLYLSVDGGMSFHPMCEELPAVAVHDLVFQEREQDLVIGTHGRSIFIADVAILPHLAAEAKTPVVLEPASVRWSASWGESWSKWFEPSEPSVLLQFYLPEPASTAVLSIEDEDGVLWSQTWTNARSGVHTHLYDCSLEGSAWAERQMKSSKNGKAYLKPGTYIVRLQAGDAEVKSTLVVKE